MDSPRGSHARPTSLPSVMASPAGEMGGGGRAVDVIYLDFSKAFDAVSHDILIAKMRKRGIEQWTVRWVENWLTGRAQRVLIGEESLAGGL